MRTSNLTTIPAPAIGRRGILLGSAAFMALSGRAAFAAAAEKAPRRQELTVGLASANIRPEMCGELTTYELAIDLESPTEAIRIGVANIGPAPYALAGVVCGEADRAHQWQKLPESKWTALGFGGAAGAVTVPGNHVAMTGATNVPAVLWSDWLPYRTFAAGRPQMLVRVLVRPQTLPMTMVGWPPRTQRVLPKFPPRIRIARAIPGDFVTDPAAPAPAGRPTPAVPLFAVQYRSIKPGIQIVVGGDSHPAQWNNFAQLAAMRLSTPSLPLAVWNVAWGAKPSRTFWPLLEMAIEQARPSVSVIEGWTANDGPKPEAWDRYVDEVQRSVAHTRRLGGIPIVFTGMPRKLFGTPEEPDWQRYNDALGARLPGALIFDLDRIVEDPARPGDWRAEFTRDRIHPNPQANAALAPAFEQLLRPLL